MASSPTNTSMKPSEVLDPSTVRNTAKAYSEETRQRFIRRMLKNMPIKQHSGKNMSIQMYNGEPMMIDPPYGFLPFALMSEKGEVSQEALAKAINFCGEKKKQFEKSGDFYRMWLYAQRQSMLSGILTHLVKFRLA